MVNFEFRVNKTSNLVHFVTNMSNWHFSCRGYSNRFWIEKTGELTEKEKKMLEDFSLVLQKSPFGNNYWGKKLLAQDNIESIVNQAKAIFADDDYRIFKEAISLFTPRFEKLWIEEEEKLTNWRTALEEGQNKFKLNGLEEDLNKLFDYKAKLEGKITVILLMAGPNNSASGGANVDKKILTLELSQTPIDFMRPVLLTLWHETVHELWDKPSDLSIKIDDFLSRNEIVNPYPNIPMTILFKEAIMESLLPRGFMAQKYFGFPSRDYYAKTLTNLSPKDGLSYWRTFSGSQLMLLSESYIKNGRSVDAEYFNEIKQLLKQI